MYDKAIGLRIKSDYWTFLTTFASTSNYCSFFFFDLRGDLKVMMGGAFFFCAVTRTSQTVDGPQLRCEVE